MTHIVGVDEVGRGPLVGPVVAAAVILDPNNPVVGLMDSKKLSEKKREAFAELIKEKALAYAIAECSPEEIDSYNILQASLLAMKRAVEQLDHPISKVYVDGNKLPDLIYPAEAIVKGDSLIECISAASIIAKVHRDHQMYELDRKHPEYGFKSHKGYPTKAHLEAIEQHGVLPLYRKTFKPVARLLNEQKVNSSHVELI